MHKTNNIHLHGFVEGVVLYEVYTAKTVVRVCYLDNYTGCHTRYGTRHFFNNFATNEDIATKCEAD